MINRKLIWLIGLSVPELSFQFIVIIVKHEKTHGKKLKIKLKIKQLEDTTTHLTFREIKHVN